MSALGVWNNRYEGGPCYAACMETFVLYVSAHLAITLQFLFAGKDAIMPREESTILNFDKKPKKCANDLPLSQWVLRRANWRLFKT